MEEHLKGCLTCSNNPKRELALTWEGFAME